VDWLDFGGNCGGLVRAPEPSYSAHSILGPVCMRPPRANRYICLQAEYMQQQADLGLRVQGDGIVCTRDVVGRTRYLTRRYAVPNVYFIPTQVAAASSSTAAVPATGT
jgi:hypothetical protein